MNESCLLYDAVVGDETASKHPKLKIEYSKGYSPQKLSSSFSLEVAH